MATFGNTSTFIDGNLGMTLDRAYLARMELPQNGELLSIIAQIGWSGGAQSVKGIVYSDLAGEPDSLLAVTSPVAAPSLQQPYLVQLDTALSLSAGFYWLGIISSGSTILLARSSTTGGTARNITDSYTSPSTTWNTAGDTETTAILNIYGTYTENIPLAFLTA